MATRTSRRRVQVEVTAADIAEARHLLRQSVFNTRARNCPMALALRRALGTGDVNVGTMGAEIRGRGVDARVKLPKAARRFIDRFDSDGGCGRGADDVEPVSFTVLVPREALAPQAGEG